MQTHLYLIIILIVILNLIYPTSSYNACNPFLIVFKLISNVFWAWLIKKCKHLTPPFRKHHIFTVFFLELSKIKHLKCKNYLSCTFNRFRLGNTIHTMHIIMNVLWWLFDMTIVPSSLAANTHTLACMNTQERHTNTDTSFIHRDLTDSLIHFLSPLEAALDYAIHPKAIIHPYQ